MPNQSIDYRIKALEILALYIEKNPRAAEPLAVVSEGVASVINALHEEVKDCGPLNSMHTELDFLAEYFGQRGPLSNLYRSLAFPLLKDALSLWDDAVRLRASELIEQYYIGKKEYEAEVFKIAVGAFKNRDRRVCDKVLDMLSRYAAKPAYEAEVFKIAVEETKVEDSSYHDEALGILCTYADKPQYVERLWSMAVDGVKNDERNREQWRHLQVLIRWSKLSWYQKAYWKTRYALGATVEQFLQAQQV
jgi:hypothetical protein